MEEPDKVWAKDELLPVDLVLGTTAHSGNSEKLRLKHKHWSDNLVKEHITKSVLGQKDLAEKTMEMYPVNYQGLISMISDIRIVCPLFAISSQMRKVPFYVVTQTRFELNLADVDSDIDAILGRYEPKTPEQRR